MKLTQKVALQLHRLSPGGVWCGDWHADKPVMHIAGETHTVNWMLDNLGIEYHKPPRYEDHGDMEEQEPLGYHEESGDGIGESQE